MKFYGMNANAAGLKRFWSADAFRQFYRLSGHGESRFLRVVVLRPDRPDCDLEPVAAWSATSSFTETAGSASASGEKPCTHSVKNVCCLFCFWWPASALPWA